MHRSSCWTKGVPPVSNPYNIFHCMVKKKAITIGDLYLYTHEYLSIRTKSWIITKCPTSVASVHIYADLIQIKWGKEWDTLRHRFLVLSIAIIHISLGEANWNRQICFVNIIHSKNWRKTGRSSGTSTTVSPCCHGWNIFTIASCVKERCVSFHE